MSKILHSWHSCLNCSNTATLSQAWGNFSVVDNMFPILWENHQEKEKRHIFWIAIVSASFHLVHSHCCSVTCCTCSALSSSIVVLRFLQYILMSIYLANVALITSFSPLHSYQLLYIKSYINLSHNRTLARKVCLISILSRLDKSLYSERFLVFRNFT